MTKYSLSETSWLSWVALILVLVQGPGIIDEIIARFISPVFVGDAPCGRWCIAANMSYFLVYAHLAFFAYATIFSREAFERYFELTAKYTLAFLVLFAAYLVLIIPAFVNIADAFFSYLGMVLSGSLGESDLSVYAQVMIVAKFLTVIMSVLILMASDAMGELVAAETLMTLYLGRPGESRFPWFVRYFIGLAFFIIIIFGLGWLAAGSIPPAP